MREKKNMEECGLGRERECAYLMFKGRERERERERERACERDYVIKRESESEICEGPH